MNHEPWTVYSDSPKIVATTIKISQINVRKTIKLWVLCLFLF